MKKKIYSLVCLFIFTLITMISLTTEVYSNSNDPLFEITIVEANSQKSELSIEELNENLDIQYNEFIFEVYIRSVGEERELSSIKASWIITNNKLSYSLDSADFYEITVGRKSYMAFESGSSNEYFQLGLGSITQQGYMNIEIPTTNIKIAEVYLVLEGELTSDDTLEFGLNFFGDESTAISRINRSMNPPNIKYDNNQIKVNSFKAGLQGEDATLKSLNIGSQGYSVSSEKINASISYLESLKPLTELIKATPNKSSASVVIKKTKGEANRIQEGDEVTITVTDGGTTKVYTITFVAIEEANLKLSELKYVADSSTTLSPSFNPDEKNYKIIIPASKRSTGFTIDPKAASSDATLIIKLGDDIQTKINNVYKFVNLTPGTHTVSIIVKVGDLENVYKLTVVQKDAEKTATLNTFIVRDQNNTTYSSTTEILLPEEANSYRMQAEFSENTISSVSFETLITSSTGMRDGTSGNFDKEINLLNTFKYATAIQIAKGETHTITIHAIAEDGSKHEYVISIKRKESSNTNLSKVEVIESTGTKTINAVNGVYTYNVTNRNDIITINPIGVLGENQTITVYKDGNLVTGGNIDLNDLEEGIHEYEIRVIAQDGTSKSYSFKIVILSTDTTFKLEGFIFGEITSIFDLNSFTRTGNTFVLNVAIPYTINKLIISVSATHTKAKVEKSGGVGDFENSANTITGTLTFNSTAEQVLTFDIKVTAENTTVTENYSIQIKREAAKTVNTLESLTINDFEVNGFIKDTTPASFLGVTVLDPSTIASGSVFVKGEVTDGETTTTVLYQYKKSTDTTYADGQSIKFDRGVTYDVRVTVTSQAGTTNTYYFQFIVASNNNKITGIQVLNDENIAYPLQFNETTTQYTINVTAQVSRVKLIVTTQDSSAKVISGVDSNGFISLNAAGLSTTVTVYAVSEAGTEGEKYQIIIARGSYRDINTIDTLVISHNGQELPINFNPLINDYKLRIDDSMDSFDILATLQDNGSYFQNGLMIFEQTYTINSGETKDIIIVVTSEKGTTRTYKISVLRANNVTEIEKVMVGDNTYLASQFVNNTLTLAAVEYSTNRLYVEVFTKKDSKATVTFTPSLMDGYWFLTKTGEIILTFEVTAQDKETKEKYYIKVHRKEPSSQTHLNLLEVITTSNKNLLDGVIPTYEDNRTIYDIKVPREVYLQKINYEPGHMNQTINKTYSNLTLSPGGTKTFTIIVTAEDGKTIHYYDIVITQKNSDNKINSIIINDNEVDLTKETKVYDLGTFSYTNRILSLDVILNDAFAKVLINDVEFLANTYELKTNETQFTIRAKAEDGSLGELYTFKYKLNEASDDNLLDSLSVSANGIELLTDMDLLNGNKSILLPSDLDITEVLVKASATKNNKSISLVVGLNDVVYPTQNINTTLKLNVQSDGSINQQFSIYVKGENNLTKTYTITIIKGSQLSDNNEIAKIELYDQNNNLITEFSEFDAMSINVPYEITHATLVVYTLDTRAKIEGSLFKALTADAATLISFKVKAESGKLSDTYTVSIYRQKANTNANLENLEVLDKNGDNLIEFDPNKNLYEIYVPRGETSFEIKYVLGHKYQTVTGKVGNITANNGEVNTYSIFVTAQDTSITNEYIVKITVKNTDNSIYSITFGEETLTVNSSFTNYVFMDVPFEISELSLDFITDQFATKVGNGLKTLKVGKNTFEIYAISELGQAGQILTVEITRLPGDSDATLKNLTVYDVTNQNMLIFDQTFDKNNYFYTITLDGKTYGSIKDIEINAEASSVYATITGLGNHKVTELSGEIDAIYSIVVTAQDGSTITYQIRIIKKKDLSNEKGIDLVEVYTLDNVLIKSFDTFNQMILEVPYEISSVKVIVHTIDPNSTVSGELVAALTPNVVKQITFKVVAENQTESSPYSVIITRKPASQNAYLDALYVYDENEVNLISFDKETYTYNLDLTRDYEKLRFEYELGHENQIVTGTIGWVTLHGGMNKFQIFVTAQDTVTKKTYTVNVNVINKDNTIKTITFGNQTIEVRENQTQYIFDDVAYQVSELNLDFVTDSYATKKGAGQKSLKVGENIFEIYAIAENGMVGKVYEIIINRLPGDSDTTLKSLEVFDLTNQVILSFDAPFHPETSIYTITLEEGYTLNQLEIKAEATSSHASILGLGVKQVIPYQNVIFEVYQITVKAEDNSTRTYEIRLLQAQSKPEPNKDYDVFDIELIGSDQINYFEGLFEPLVGLQTSVTVPYHVTSVQLQAIISEGASLVGRNNLKVYALTPGKSITIEVQAKAENGDLNPIIYTIEVTRLEGSKDNELKELKILEIENDILHTEFDLTQNYIKVYIEKTTKNIEIKAVGPENAKVTYGDVVISSTKKLHHIFVQSEDLSIEPRIYTIEIDTVKDSNASIQDLIVTTLDGDILNISPAFNPTIKKYALDITGLDITHIDVNVIPNSPYASVLNDGVLQLTTKEGKSTETFVFTVVAEDGITKETIELTVTREVDPKDDVTIHDISLIGNDSKNYLGYQNALNRFESHIYEYEITVPYAVHTLNLNIYNMNGATSNKSGLFTLKDPSEVNVIEFIMVSLSGKTSKPYKITVHRELPSTDNTLKDLKINGKSIENFDSENLYYEIVVDELKVDSIIIEGVKNDSTALISGDGEKEIKPGTNTFVVEVTAEDGSKRNYIVSVKSQSFDTSLKSLEVVDYPFTEVFDANRYNYQVNVPYQVDMIEIIGEAHPKALIYGLGTKRDLNVGSNIFVVYVVSESGARSLNYQIEVIREKPSDDATLKFLHVYDANGNLIEFTSSFVSTTYDYIVYLDSQNIMSVNIDAKPNDPKAQVFNTGNQLLEGLIDGKYHTIISIPVMAESGKVLKYTISFYREIKLEDIAEIEELNLYGSDNVIYIGTDLLSKVQFDKSNTGYTITVPYDISTMNLQVKARGIVYGDGIKAFGNSNLIVYSVYVKSLSQINQSDVYTIHVIREEALTENKLSSLTLNGVNVPNFNPDINSYEMSLPFTQNPIIQIGATAFGGTITGIGTFELKSGKNIFPVTVRAQNGEINTYTLTINYVDSNALLESLHIKGSDKNVYDDSTAKLYDDFIFNPEAFEYIIKIDTNIKYVRITGAAQDTVGAQVVGFGTYNVGNTEEKVYIYVRSADGLITNVYTLRIVKEHIPSNNAQLASLSVGGYELTFDKNTYQYYLSVKGDVNDLLVYASALHPNAKVSIVDYEHGTPSQEIQVKVDGIEQGKNVILIKVVAEDGTEAYYRLHVVKEAQPDYLLTVLLIAVILLWVSTVVFFLIKQSRQKKDDRRNRMII